MTNYLWILPNVGKGYTAAYRDQGWVSKIGHVVMASFVIDLTSGEIIKHRTGSIISPEGNEGNETNPIQYLVDNEYITKVEALDLRLKLNL